MSVILHYSVSSCFSWCLVDSLFLYFTHTNSSHPLRKNIYYLLLGWGKYLAKNVSKGESCNKKIPIAADCRTEKFSIEGVIRDCHGFTEFCFVLGPENLSHPLN